MIPRLHIKTCSIVLLAACGLLAAGALAQMITTGTIKGQLQGEERTWYTIGMDGPEPANSAEWTSMGGIQIITVQGHQDERFSVEGTLSLELTFFSVPQDCPCTADEATITYFATSATSEFFQAEDAETVLTEVERIGDDTRRLAGEFRAVMLYRPDWMSDLDPDNTLEISGQFEVEAAYEEF